MKYKLSTLLKNLLIILFLVGIINSHLLFAQTFPIHTSSIQTLNNKVSYRIPVKGNGYYLNPLKIIPLNEDEPEAPFIWNNPNVPLQVYFYPQQLGEINVSIQLTKNDRPSTFEITLDELSPKQVVRVPPSNKSILCKVGKFKLTKEGYHYLNIRPISTKGIAFPFIDSVEITSNNIKEIKFNKSGYRGAASTHLRYSVPGDSVVKWFYTEVLVPKEVENSVHAYYETNGFHSGYGGIQINSFTERRFIFSIWSKYVTDDPSKIPMDYAVNLKNKGTQVFTGEFGNEGSGGHSHLVFPWEVNKTYHFLTGVKSIAGDSATYVGYYASPDDNYTWHLLSEWTQNKTDTKLGFQRLYAFVENFGNNGNDFFKAYYGNQWVVTPSGHWIELNQAKFTTTANEQKHQRYDYGAGVEGNLFYMYTGGFKHIKNINAGDTITRPLNKVHPAINFEQLLDKAFN